MKNMVEPDLISSYMFRESIMKKEINWQIHSQNNEKSP